MKHLLTLAGVALALSACVLSEDLTPPPNVTTQPRSTPPPLVTSAPTAELGYPLTLDLERGAGIFQARCAQCHGPQGQGDGALSAQLAEQRGAPAPKLADPAFAASKTPAEWFAVVTQGRIEKLMPPFAGSLTEAERWDVVAYAFSLSVSPTVYAVGEQVYAAACAACHGAQGEAVPTADLSSARATLNMSAQTARASLTAGMAGTHQFPNLTPAEQEAVSAYTRALAWGYLDPQTAQTARLGTVNGQVTQGTRGASLPPALTVNVYAFSGNTLLETYTVTTDAQGYFAAPEVQVDGARQFVAATTYQNVVYGSPAGQFITRALDLPITLYEVTDDPSVLTAPQLQIFFQFSSATEVTIGEVYALSNQSDRTYRASAARPLIFRVPDEAGAVDVRGRAPGENYEFAADGVSLFDPIPPGEQVTRLFMAYRAPFADGFKFVARPPVPVAQIGVLVASAEVTAQGDRLRDLGVEDFQGTPIHSYAGPALNAHAEYAFTLSAPSPLMRALGGSALELALAGLALAAVLGAVGWWLYTRRAPAGEARAAPPTAPGPADPLIQVIADLDDAYARGEVAEADYQARRAALKAEVLRRMNQHDEAA